MTPSNSPFFKSRTPRSPTKGKSQEPGLRLKKIIGTTTASANGFDCLPSARQFAYTAGAAAVVCTVDDDLKVTQRFFRARPTLNAGLRDTSGPGPISPTPNEARSRVLGNVRDHGMNCSPLGASARDWSDSPTGKTATAKDRVKAATSVALSPNGKWVAMGETGYRPRILIFSNGGDSSESPVCALAEHTFGVHALAFSPDGKYLASLGTVNDGFLYIWTIDDRNGFATLHSSNKCTVLINAMTWVGNSVLTVGLRFVRLWHPDDGNVAERRNLDSPAHFGTPRQKTADFGNSVLSPRHRFLPGKNCLLGDLIDANFVAALPIPNDKVIICADSGEVCVVDDCQRTQSLHALDVVNFRISSARMDGHGGLIIAGTQGQTKKLEPQALEQRRPTSSKKNRRQTVSPSKALFVNANCMLAMATIANISVELDSRRGIRLTRSDSQDGQDIEPASHQLAAHGDSVLGVHQLTSEAFPNAAFFTFSGNGTIQVWGSQGSSIASLQVPVETSREMYDVTNELRAVKSLRNTLFLAAGDKYGMLSILDISTGSITTQVRAHSTEVVDIVTLERSGIQFIVTASRDRTLQLFAYNDAKLDLLQTMDEHASAVCGLLPAQDDTLLLSCSTDRSVIVREIISRPDDPGSIACAMLRTIILKSSPTSMCLDADNGVVLVSTADRSIATYNIKSGQAVFSFKCADMEGGETAALSKILYAPSLNGNPTIVGVSSGDKSVRLYSEYGSMIARDWGHTEGITDLAILPPAADEDGEEDSRAQIVTVAADSTVFIWDTISLAPTPTTQSTEGYRASDTPIANKVSTPMGPPLRKVLSFSELSRFQRKDSAGGEEPTSPPANIPTQAQPTSPPRVKRKTSRMSVAQPPRLEPAFRSSFADPIQRKRRSPSPPSPRGATKRDVSRKPSLGMALRSKSSENVLSSYASANGASSFGSVTSSTESVCRTLRAYRKKLSNSSATDSIAPDVLRELEKDLELTARVVGEKSQGKNVDEAMMAKLLDQASEKIVTRLDERIKERVESEVRKSSEESPSSAVVNESPADVGTPQEQMDAVTGALEKIAINE